jgi:hypothetical protein
MSPQRSKISLPPSSFIAALSVSLTLAIAVPVLAYPLQQNEYDQCLRDAFSEQACCIVTGGTYSDRTGLKVCVWSRTIVVAPGPPSPANTG